jgi:hypothetical protein
MGFQGFALIYIVFRKRISFISPQNIVFRYEYFGLMLPGYRLLGHFIASYFGGTKEKECSRDT